MIGHSSHSCLIWESPLAVCDWLLFSFIFSDSRASTLTGFGSHVKATKE